MSAGHRAIGLTAAALVATALLSAVVVGGAAATERPGIAVDRGGAVASPVVDDTGDTDLTSTMANDPPTADITHSPTSPEVGQTVSFDASGSTDSDGTLVEYAWDFDGDGTYETSTAEPTVTHSYSTAGTRSATVRVTDDDGTTDTATTTVGVNGPPTADLTHSPTAPEPGESVSFDASGSIDSDGTIVQYDWDFDGDGTYETSTADPTVSHSYTTGGDRPVTVRTTDDDGTTDTATTTVTVVTNQPPTADLTHSPTDPEVDQTVSFDASGTTDADGTVVEYDWDFDGDGTYERTTSSATVDHSYSSGGDRTVTVRARDDDGATDTATTTVTVVANQAPTADLAHAPAGLDPGQTVTFDAGSSVDGDGTVVEYEWDFDGDGTYERTTASATVEHAYDSAGDRTASVRVTDDDGATDAAITSVTVVANQAPAADVSHSPAGPEVEQTVTVDASGSTDGDGTVVEYEWDLDGDGTYERTTEAATVEYAYSTDGDRTVTVRTTDDDGATDTATTTISVSASNTPRTTTSTADPTETTTSVPTSTPTDTRTSVPTSAPTETATSVPTSAPTETATSVPTSAPGGNRTAVPTDAANVTRTAVPSDAPVNGTTPRNGTAPMNDTAPADGDVPGFGPAAALVALVVLAVRQVRRRD